MKSGIAPTHRLKRIFAGSPSTVPSTPLEISGASTGYVDVDLLIDGLHDGELVVVAGRSGMGKSTLAYGLATNMARFGSTVLFSPETDAATVRQHILAGHSAVPFNEIRRGALSSDDLWRVKRIEETEKELSSLDMYIDDSCPCSVSQVAESVFDLQKRAPLSLIAVDGLRLMVAGAGSGNNRPQEITAIMAGLKAVARNAHTPVVVFSGLPRRVDDRENKRPMVSDLSEAGAILDEADLVLFLYRHEYYLAQREPTPGSNDHIHWMLEMERYKGIAEVSLAKRRHGGQMSGALVRLAFEPEIPRLSNLAHEDGGGPPTIANWPLGLR